MKRRLFFALAFALLLASAAAARSASTNSTAAAQACSAGRPLAARLPAGDVAYLRRFVACVTKHERRQLGLRYNQSPALSAAVARALRHLVALRLHPPHDRKLDNSATQGAVRSIAAKLCPGRTVLYSLQLGDSTPPGLTPIAIARVLALHFRPNVAAREPSAVFGVAARKGVLFEGGNLHGESFAWLGLVCG